MGLFRRKKNDVPAQQVEAPVTRDLVARDVHVRADTVDSQARTARATLATEQRVMVFDLRNMEVIEEILRMDGAVLPDQTPLLDSHFLLDLSDQIGSARSLQVTGGQEPVLEGTLHFVEAVEGADNRLAMPEHAWRLVRDGHARDVSIGYRPLDNGFVDIQPGETATVRGTEYTAGDLVLRVTTSWQVVETSVTPVGADPRAKVRESARSVVWLRGHGWQRTTPRESQDGERAMSRQEPGALGALLTTAIEDEAEASGRSVDEVHREAAEAAELDTSALEQLKDGNRQSPGGDAEETRSAIDGLASVLPVSEEELIEAAEQDGCTVRESQTESE